jgi:hypothetical protein
MLNDAKLTIRPIHPDDEPLMVRFHQTVSERSVYFRYLHMMGLGHLGSQSPHRPLPAHAGLLAMAILCKDAHMPP